MLIQLLKLCLLSILLSGCYCINPPKKQQWPQPVPQPCPKQCSCTSDTAVCKDWSSTKENASLPKLPSETSVLSIYNWPRSTIKLTHREGLKSLRLLKISKSRLETFPKMHPSINQVSFFDLSQNEIHSLPTNAFQNMPYLTHLNVSWNRIVKVDNNFLKGTKELMVLDMSHNPIHTLSEYFFHPTRKLSYLDLSHASLKEIKPSHTKVFKYLFFLDLSWNAIAIIPNFSGKYLEALDLSHNPLSKVSLGPMNKLNRLNISYTNVSQIDEIMRETSNIEDLDVSFTQLSDLNKGVFQNCHILKRLHLGGNNLALLKATAFSGLTNLIKLHLDNCQLLVEIEDHAFKNMLKLEELSLQNTGIRVLPKSVAALSLKQFSIQNTSLWCDCHAQWIPGFLSSSNFDKLKGFDPIKCKNNVEMSVIELEDLLYHEQCAPVEVVSPENQWTLVSSGESALLECNVTGEPTPDIIWQTVDHQVVALNKTEQVDTWISHRITEALNVARTEDGGKFQVLESGQLLIRDVQRKDIGRYKCFAYNAVSNASYVTFIGLDATSTRIFLIETALFGWGCAAVFLLISLLVQFIKYMLDRLGCECCCCKDRLSPKAKQIGKLLETVESYKTAQLERLRENYNSQVASIKDSCYYQMEKVRESYLNQSKNLRSLCDYSTQQISGAREQYTEQMTSIREYSVCQMNRVRENYVFQRQRIRKFSAHQLLRLRETYKYQQKTLNKLLETLPDLYIQNCRTGVCQRTDSIMFDELGDLDIYYKVDLFDGQSSASSQYYTPNSTISRKPMNYLYHDHSRSGSIESGMTKVDAKVTIENPNIKPLEQSKPHRRFHFRSFSLIVPPAKVHRTPKCHKRCNSETKNLPEPSQQDPLIEESATSQTLSTHIHDQRKANNPYAPSLQIVDEIKQTDRSLTGTGWLSKSDTVLKTGESKHNAVTKSSPDILL